MKIPIAAALLLLTALGAVAFQTTHVKAASPPSSLTAYVPQDALLSIESPDFAALLHRWTASTESRNWLRSDHYSVFTNSRLFSRLNDAQTSFAEAAGLPPDAGLLNQVAGSESVFAWYDVGKLEFLYITRMPVAQASQTLLLQSRAKFQRRHAGNADFYIRVRGNDPARTVAFAQVPSASGDLLLLATREDLIANALMLIAKPGAQSLSQEPWFTDASSALPPEKSPPVLHMVLNLDRIVPMPYFRSYWVQRNITWMGQFRAAASDLYLEPARFREERVLLPKNSLPSTSSSAELSALSSMVPPGSGVFRAVSTTSPPDAVAAINSKLLGVYTPEKTRELVAGDPDLTMPQPGSPADLETRIDTPAVVSESASTEALERVAASAGLNAILTISSASPPSAPRAVWLPIHSAVVLRGGVPWNAEALASALQMSLRGSLTTANLGIDFGTGVVAGQTIYSLTGPRPLFFAIPDAGNLAVLTDDQPLLLALLARRVPAAAPDPVTATLIAGFDHTGQRPAFARITSLIDGTNHPAKTPRVGASNTPPDASAAPTFFSQEMRSLSDSFSRLESEQVFERIVDTNLRQTVTYNWHQP